MPKSPADKVATRIPVTKTVRRPNLKTDMIKKKENAEKKVFQNKTIPVDHYRHKEGSKKKSNKKDAQY